MTLVPAKERGLWRDDATPDGTPGVHALVAGVSAYTYLAGGSDPVPDTLGMGQLVVSASGAAQVFRWLREVGRLVGRPVVSCRLLLAPGASVGADGTTEQAFVDAITGGWHEDPVFKNLDQAIKGWADEFWKVPPERCAESAALFFFSGHGFEVSASPSLLARDILDKRSAQGRRNAVAYRRVREALPTYGLGDGVFLFDACRTAPEAAQVLNIVGQDVLEPAPSYRGGAQRSLMWLAATRAGVQAYQDPQSPRRASLFGQAVLEALEGFPPQYRPYDVAQVPWRLLFRDFEAYVANRVRELLAAKDAMKVQTVSPGGDPTFDEMVFAERAPAVQPVPLLRLLDGSPWIGKHDLGRDLRRYFVNPSEGELWPAPPPTSPAAAVLGRFDVSPAASGHPLAAAGDASDLTDFSVMHSVFGHENTTTPWVRMLSLLDAATGEPADPRRLRLVSGKTSRRDALTWIDLELAPGLGQCIWLALNPNEAEDGSFLPNRAVLLPHDSAPTPVRLEVAFAPNGERWQWMPASLTARVAEPSGAADGSVWKVLWEAQRAASLASLGQAVSILERSEASAFAEVLRGKRRSPLAAAVAAATLLQAGALEHLRDWPRNLAHWFPQLADGPVLWAETLLSRQRRRQGPPPGMRGDHASDQQALNRWWKQDDTSEAARSFAELAERGPPVLGPVLVMAMEQAALWRPRIVACPDLALADRIGRGAARIADAGARLVPDSLFPAFVSVRGPIGPPAAYRKAPGARSAP